MPKVTQINQLNGISPKILTRIPSLVLLALIFLLSCNPTRDRWINRKWHTLTGHYNIFFNGQLKLNTAIMLLAKSHPNDFNKVLDVFPYGTDAQAKANGNVIDEAMKKFSGAIQLHNIGAYTDDAYFEIAKCYFFKQDYYSAMDAFQYMIGKYPKQYKQISTAWIAKCFLGMEKTEEAEAIINLLVADKNISSKDVAEIFATAAAINVKLEKYKQATDQLNRALTGKLDKETKIRYHFILGQLYAIQDKTKEALFHFDKSIKLLPSYEFGFNATINMTRLYDPKNKSMVNKVRRRLKNMADDEKNVDYLDQVFYELGMVEMGQKNMPQAVNYFKLSCAKSKTNKAQKTRSYYELAKLFFATKDYKNAQAYYDSTAGSMDKKEKSYEQIRSFKLVLTDLVNNLKAFETDDSLLELSKLSKQALADKVNTWFEADKKQKELDAKLKKKQEKAMESMQNNQQEETTNPLAMLNASADNANLWYFYNPLLVSQGKLEFQGYRKWGQRQNEDFWRIASKEKPKLSDTGSTSTGKEKSDNPNENTSKKEDNKESNDGAKDGAKDPEHRKTGKEIHDEIVAEKKSKVPVITGDPGKDVWIKDVPFTQMAKNNAHNRILEALHNLGKIYYEKLKDYASALKYYNELQNRYPASEYEAETFYYLSKIYSDIKNEKLANQYKDLLLKTYPESPYAALIQGKAIKTVDNDSNKELVKFYEKMYAAYDSGQYTLVKKMSQQSELLFPGNKFKARIDFLNAQAIGHTDSISLYVQALKDIKTNHKGTEFAERATSILAIIQKAEKKKQIAGNDSALNDFNMDIDPDAPMNYVLFVKNEKADFTIVNEKFAGFNESYFSTDNLRSNTMLTSENYQMLIVREFPNFNKGMNYISTAKSVKLLEQSGIRNDFSEMLISSANFKTVLKEKKIDLYIKLFQKMAAQFEASQATKKEPK